MDKHLEAEEYSSCTVVEWIPWLWNNSLTSLATCQYDSANLKPDRLASQAHYDLHVLLRKAGVGSGVQLEVHRGHNLPEIAVFQLVVSAPTSRPAARRGARAPRPRQPPRSPASSAGPPGSGGQGCCSSGSSWSPWQAQVRLGWSRSYLRRGQVLTRMMITMTRESTGSR